MHSRQQGRSGGCDLLVMTSLTLGWSCLVGSWPDSPFFIGAPDSCTGAKANLLPRDIPKHPSCLIPSGSRQPLRMMYGRAQRKGKWRLERGLRKCDNSSAPKGLAGAGRLAQGVTVMVIKVLPASLSTVRLLQRPWQRLSGFRHTGSRGSRLCFLGKSHWDGILPPRFLFLLARAQPGKRSAG